ncbi:hypothetical protein [Methylobacterium nigriterrae]|uniref:hypothetical protein n=1 Tax=Methylobacterium nigriterrae TaxID=3127512 RepID=UPI00301373F2
MARAGTDDPETGQVGAQASRPGTRERALVALPDRQGTSRSGTVSPVRGPLAGFVAQLIVSADPRLRPSRGERTRSAVALYAEAARRRA